MTYEYQGLTFPIPNNSDVYLSVEFLTSGNIGPTSINVPGSNDQRIAGQGQVKIGTGASLRNAGTVIVSDVSNFANEVQEIKVQYKINGTVIKTHSNNKSDSNPSTIELIINFPPE